ncbi:MAG: UDP-glucose 4-epimerase [Bacteroidia bacterium]|jgi:UDP-glucose 4-epimerase
MSKILVTGGLGYIGSHTVVELQQLGHEVVVVDNLSNTTIEVKARIEKITGKTFTFYNIDVCNTSALNNVFEKEQIHGVIHFAAYKAVGESVDKPTEYYHNNISGLISLLNCTKKYTVSSIVFSSSCTVYGDTKDSPITEDQPVVEAISPYGTTKIIGEQILKDYAKFSDTKIVSLRYFNPVGAHETALIGELPLGIPSNLIPYLTQTAAGIRQQLTVFGKDYNTPDGTNIRDYIHVVDLAKAHVKAIEYCEQTDLSYDTFNLGTGKGHSVLEVIQTFETINDLKLSYRFGPRRQGDVEQIWADTTKASTILGWQTELTLEEMMRSSWAWQQRLQQA